MAAEKKIFFKTDKIREEIETAHAAQQQAELSKRISQWNGFVKQYPFLQDMISDKLKQILLATFTSATAKAMPPLIVDPVKVAAATAVLNNFLNDPKQVGKFSQISKQDLVNDILAKIQNPVSIDQGGLNLCGPNAFASAWALRDPEAYAKGIIELYTKGKAEIGSVNISVNKSTYKQNPKPILSPADFVLLPAIRHGNNALFWYNPAHDQGFRAFTTPSELAMWLESIDNATVKRYESNAITPQELSRRYDNGATIIFLIEMEYFLYNNPSLLQTSWSEHYINLVTQYSLQDQPHKLSSPVGNHYITLASTFLLSNDKNEFTFSIWNWGAIQSVTMTLERFQASVHEIFVLDNE